MPIIVQYDDPSLMLTDGTNAGNFAAGQQEKKTQQNQQALNQSQQRIGIEQQQVDQSGAYQQGELGQGQQRISNQSDQYYDTQDFQKQQAQDQFQRQQALSEQANAQRLQQIAAMGQNRMDYGTGVVLPQQEMRNQGSLDNTTVKADATVNSANIRAGATTQAAGIRADASTDNAMVHANAMTQRPSVQSNPETQGRLAGQQVIEQHNAVQRGIGFQMKTMQMDPRVSGELLDPTSESSMRFQSLMSQYKSNEDALPGKIDAAKQQAARASTNTASATPQAPAEAQPNSPGAARQQLPNAAQIAPQSGQIVYVYNTNANQVVAGRFAGFQPGPNGQQGALVNIPGHGPQLFDPQHVLLPGSNRTAGNGVPMQNSDSGQRAPMQREQANVQQPLQYAPQNAQTSRGTSNQPGIEANGAPDVQTMQAVVREVNQQMAGQSREQRKAEIISRLQKSGYDTSGL